MTDEDQAVEVQTQESQISDMLQSRGLKPKEAAEPEPAEEPKAEETTEEVQDAKGGEEGKLDKEHEREEEREDTEGRERQGDDDRGETEDQTPAKEGDVEEELSEVDRMRKQMEDWAGGELDRILGVQPTPSEATPTHTQLQEASQEQSVEEPQARVEPVQRPSGQDVVFQFVQNEEDLNEVLSNPESFNKALTALVHNVRENAKTEAVSAASKQLDMKFEVYRATDQFFRDNEDLKKYQKLATVTTMMLESQHPDWGVNEIFRELGPAMRETLGLKKAEAKVEPAGTRPRGRRGGRRPKVAAQPAADSQQGQMAEMLASHRRRTS